MGSDSLYLNGWHRVRTPHPKIFRKGDLLIGTSGDQRISDIIEYNFDPEEDYRDDPVDFLGMDFLPAMRDAIKKRGGMKEEDMEATVMIGYKGGLFIIGEDFSRSRVGPYEAIGSGANTHTPSHISPQIRSQPVSSSVGDHDEP